LILQRLCGNNQENSGRLSVLKYAQHADTGYQVTALQTTAGSDWMGFMSMALKSMSK
jgi:hypothetical protein